MKAVNAHGGFGHWSWDVSKKPGQIHDILGHHAAVTPAPRPLGQWLIDNVPPDLNLEISSERASRREIPFVSDDS